MLVFVLPVRAELRGLPLRFSFPPMTSRGHSPGLTRLEITVETLDEPRGREDLVLEPCNEDLWVKVHQLYRARTTFIVPRLSGSGD